MSKLIPKHLASRCVVQSAAIWFALRATLFAFGTTSPPASVSLLLVTFVAALGWLDMLRRREWVFLNNLGVHPATVSALHAATAIVLEVSVSFLPLDRIAAALLP
jgi:hypothetical protein